MEEFKSLQELYNRVKPALVSKRNELIRSGIKYIKEEDIWNYLRDNKWTKTVNLSLSELVNDILNADNHSIDKYVQQKINAIPREANVDDTNTSLAGER
jgi:hypothetical protein